MTTGRGRKSLMIVLSHYPQPGNGFWNDDAMKIFDLVIFDCDRVLADSEKLG
jgi:hypothetical protein